MATDREINPHPITRSAFDKNFNAATSSTKPSVTWI